MPSIQRRASFRTRFIGALKILLPVIAIALLSTIFLWSKYSEKDGTVLSVADRDALSDGLRLLKPHFSGSTEKGEPYSVTADWALPDGLDPTEVELENLVGELALEDGRNAQMLANAANWHRENDVFYLKDGIKLTTDDGYVLLTEKASVDLKKRQVITDSPVDLSGPAGDIQADKMIIGQTDTSKDGQVESRYIRFEGNVKVFIQPESVKKTNAEQ